MLAQNLGHCKEKCRNMVNTVKIPHSHAFWSISWSDPYMYISSKIVSLLKDQNERPKTRDILNTLYLFALPNAPKFTRNSFENFERFDSWLIQLYVKVQGAKTTAEEIIKCFLQNLEYEDVRGVINTNSITTKY